MDQILAAQNINELKQAYRQLACIFHPDKGGNLSLMQQLNKVFKEKKQMLLNHITYSTNERAEDFTNIKVGQIIYVNGTLCEVLSVNDVSFRVLAIGRTRQAVFDKTTGWGLYNKALRASFDATKNRPK